MNPMRVGDWMQTASGRQFWPLDPRPEEIDIEDIACALSKLCRYNGHCRYAYSVAQHSVYVSHQVPPEHALAALLHDATEAYCADVPRPLKPFLTGYAAIEARIWRAVAERFGLPQELPRCVHDADNAVLLAEKAQIMSPAPADWNVPGLAAPIRIAYWGAELAREAFLSRFTALMRERTATNSAGVTSGCVSEPLATHSAGLQAGSAIQRPLAAASELPPAPPGVGGTCLPVAVPASDLTGQAAGGVACADSASRVLGNGGVLGTSNDQQEARDA